MPDKIRRKPRKKPISVVLVVVKTGEATPLTPAAKARIMRGTSDLLEEQADELDPPPTTGE